jgi:hypothetical protein
MCVDFYYKLILINKFTKHNLINNLCCDIKYFDLYLSLNFFQLRTFLFFSDDFYLFIYTVVYDLFN